MPALRALAPAKLNLSLHARRVDSSGLHPVRGLTLSIGWYDILVMSPAESDHLEIHGTDLPTGDENLVWKAVSAVRSGQRDSPPARFELWKRIPVAAGLAGGSSDAAAALLLYGSLAGRDRDQVARLAAAIGADVSFCLRGGLRWIGGYGEQLGDRLDRGGDFVLVVAVPPFMLETARVYSAWDRLGEPKGRTVSGTAIPPGIRRHGPLVNDLYPAAVSIEPDLDDWRVELESRWDRPVLMSGSGPSLYAFFPDQAEAEEGLDMVPNEARDAFVALPQEQGVHLVEDGR
ncbi:MAG: hypothetical protein J4G11_13385 [Acidimicrobiia bacterium]|nr:hypothetical protein [Acidimicrobiia bacterium]